MASDALPLPNELTLLSSTPPGEIVGRQLQWRLGEIGARQRRTISVNFRAHKLDGIVNSIVIVSCCDVVAAGGLKVRDCATTTVAVPSLEVQVTGPGQATVGSKVKFEIVVTNRSPTPATRLVITDRLDPGLENPAVNQRNAIERPLGDLAPGASRRVNVTLGVAKPGRLCHTVEVTGKDLAPASQRACLTAVGEAAPPGPSVPNAVPNVVPNTVPNAVPNVGPSVVPPSGGGEPPKLPPNPIRPLLSVKKTGPKQLIVGETANFSIELTNAGSVAMRNIKVLDHYDPALLPKFATDGYRLEDGGLAWTVEDLAAGQTTELRIQCLCQSAAAKTCNRATATTSDGGKVEDEACLEIRAVSSPPAVRTPAPPPPPSAAAAEGLIMSVIGLRNPVTAGKELTYEIKVTNNGPTTYRQATVTATVPDDMIPNPMGTVGPGPTKFAIEGKSVRFDPVFEVRPNESLIYRIRVQTKQPGLWRFLAELTAATLSQPLVKLVKETSTEVN